MSRRAASFTQADIARALRAAEQVAPGRYRVRISNGEIIVEPAGQGDNPAEFIPENIAPPREIIL